MKTLTVTEARKNLSGWLRRAKAGEEIGIIDGNQIVALRPIRVVAADYMETEYGLTKKEADQAGQRIRDEAERGSYISLAGLKTELANRGKVKRREHA